MKKYLVTGSQGFIGKNLVRALLASEADILEINEDIFEDASWSEILSAKILDYRPDVFFHVGACSNTLESRSQYIMERNFESTKVLVDLSKVLEVPMIYSSSAANYGVNGRYPSNLYGWSKYVAEKYVSSNRGVSLRYFNVYGPGENHKGRMASFFHQALNLAERGEMPQLFPGTPKRDFIYIPDVISANLTAVENFPMIRGGIFDVGTGVARSFEEALDFMNIEYRYAAQESVPIGYQNFTCADQLKMLPGWQSRYSLEDGLKEYLSILDNHRFR